MTRFWPAVSTVRAQSRKIIALVPNADWMVAGWVFALKFLLLIFGAKSYQILEDHRPDGEHPWLELWNRWDAVHYHNIAQFGYGATESIKQMFYPLYPSCVWLLAQINGDYLVSAFIVAGAASLAAAVLLRRLVALDYSPAVALRSVWFFLIFPTAYFLHIGYTEGLFIALALGSLFAARTGRWWLAGLLGALCWGTRPTGIVLLPTLAVEAAHQFWITRRWNWRWLWIGIVPVGFSIYLLLNFQSSGDPFTFLRVRKGIFGIIPDWPWVGIQSAIDNFRRVPNEAEMVGAQELYFVLLGLLCMIVSWIKLRPAYAVWITGNWLLFTCATFIASAPRYSLPLFPIFILFALLAANRFWNALITVWSLLYLALFASLFVRGWWAF